MYSFEKQEEPGLAVNVEKHDRRGFGPLVTFATGRGQAREPERSAGSGHLQPLDRPASKLELANAISREPQANLFEKLDRLWPISSRATDLAPSKPRARAVHSAIVKRHSRLPARLANLHLSRVGQGMDFDDLLQEGLVSLMKAIAKFDPYQGKSFGSFAIKFVYFGIDRAISNQGALVRLPVETAQKVRRLKSVIQKKLLVVGVRPGEKELAAELGISASELQELQELSPLEGDNGWEGLEELDETLEDVQLTSPIEEIAEASLKRAVGRALSTLAPLEERVLRMRFGTASRGEQTAKEIGRRLGLSCERIGWIEAKALRKLGHPAAATKLRKSLL